MAFVKLTNCLYNPKQIIKLFVLILCICFTVNQVTECVNKLMHPPISTYYKFHLNKSVYYPSLTICRRPGYKVSLFEKYGVGSNNLYTVKAFPDFKFDKYTVGEFLEATTYSAQEMFLLFGFKGESFDKLLNLTSKFYISRGRCILVTPLNDTDIFSENGGYVFNFRHDKLTTNYDELPGFDIFLHKGNEVLDDTVKNTFMEHIILNTKDSVKFNLNVQIVKQISTSDDPCATDPDYSKSKCEETCIHSKAAMQAGCTLPWLTGNAHFPQCNDAASVKKLIDGFNDLNRSTFLQTCDCSLIGCDLSIYKANVQTTEKDSKFIDIKMFFASNLITYMEEVLGYDANVFLSDLGGSLGFLLGLSVIGIIEFFGDVIDLIICIKRNCKKKQLPSEDSCSVGNDIASEKKKEEKRNLNVDKVVDYLTKSEAEESYKY